MAASFMESLKTSCILSSDSQRTRCLKRKCWLFQKRFIKLSRCLIYLFCVISSGCCFMKLFNPSIALQIISYLETSFFMFKKKSFLHVKQLPHILRPSSKNSNLFEWNFRNGKMSEQTTYWSSFFSIPFTAFSLMSLEEVKIT